ncbi:hypothetical protein CRG98_036791, partial [Punica granatum]
MASISAAAALPEPVMLSSTRRASAIGSLGPVRPKSAHLPRQLPPSQAPLLSEEGCGLQSVVARGFARRKVLASSSALISLAFLIDSRNKEGFAEEFADMPALRGKDYGKTKMRFPDYTETESGLQYK